MIYCGLDLFHCPRDNQSISSIPGKQNDPSTSLKQIWSLWDSQRTYDIITIKQCRTKFCAYFQGIFKDTIHAPHFKRHDLCLFKKNPSCRYIHLSMLPGWQPDCLFHPKLWILCDILDSNSLSIQELCHNILISQPLRSCAFHSWISTQNGDCQQRQPSLITGATFINMDWF